MSFNQSRLTLIQNAKTLAPSNRQRGAYDCDESPAIAEFKGVLQADAYASFDTIFEDVTVREAAYWAHARRKFHDLHAARPTPLTIEALRRIAELYLIEAEILG